MGSNIKSFAENRKEYLIEKARHEQSRSNHSLAMAKRNANKTIRMKKRVL